MNLLLFLSVLYVFHVLGTYKLYKKVGRKQWEVLVPIYNYYILIQIVGRPKWWMLLLFVPVINNIILLVLYVNLVKCFGKTTSKDMWLTIITLGLYVFTVNFDDKSRYNFVKPKDKGFLASIVFAIVAATVIRTFSFEAYVIPTPSMEKSLLVGDFLFVNKFSYGVRTPMTPVSIPMVHDKVPILGLKSYISSIQLPYFRFLKFSEIKNNDIVVFNWPVDTIDENKVMYKPIDKRTNYVKRCIAIPGDSLKIVNGNVYINNQPQMISDRIKLQHYYRVETDGRPLNISFLKSKYGVTDDYGRESKNVYRIILTKKVADIIKGFNNVKSIERFVEPIVKRYSSRVFPYTKNWNGDNYGPIYIPKKGVKIALNMEVLPFYKRVIIQYEGNTLEVKENQIYINGKLADTYTFKQNYYWMMGDNRHNSLDSRYWGYVPESHIVGKPVLVWMSWNTHTKNFLKKIRWDRLITLVHGNGKPTSYFIPLLIVLALLYGVNKYRKRKKIKTSK